jgi:hypothetical protein
MKPKKRSCKTPRPQSEPPSSCQLEEYPDQYLHIRDSRSGQTWIRPLRATTKLDLKKLVKKWIREEWGGERRLTGEITPRMEGDYYAMIKLNAEPPDSISVHASGGFYTVANDT